MKITGIIAEYNPFHTGHAYQLEKISGEASVAVMSGSFVQRGDVAIADKWTRARLAVTGGVDLVVELPVIFALNTAQKFALGAVSLLDSMGVDELCFGSECGDIVALTQTAQLIEHEPPEISLAIKKLIGSGMSYPAAREEAYSGRIPSGIISAPNNILAVEYLRALIRLDSKIVPITVKRRGAGYNDLAPGKDFASAAAIRQMLRNGENAENFTEFLGIPTDLSRLDSAVIAKLRMITPDMLSRINEVNEGLENRILRAAAEFSTIDDVAGAVKTKRYTMSRIRRVLISCLLGITSDMDEHLPDYIRVLAMNETGKAVLKELKNRSTLPIITKAADYKGSSPLFDMDVRATDIAALCENKNKKSGRDFTVSPHILT